MSEDLSPPVVGWIDGAPGKDAVNLQSRQSVPVEFKRKTCRVHFDRSAVSRPEDVELVEQ